MNDVMQILAAQAPPASGDLKVPVRKDKPNGPSLFEQALKARAKAEELRVQMEKTNTEDPIEGSSRSRAHSPRKAVTESRRMDLDEKKLDAASREQAEVSKKASAESEVQNAPPTAQPMSQASDEKAEQATETGQHGESTPVNGTGGAVSGQAGQPQLKQANGMAKADVDFAAELAADGAQEPGSEAGTLAASSLKEANLKNDMAKVDLKGSLDPAQPAMGKPAVEGNPPDGTPAVLPQNETASPVKPVSNEATLKKMQGVQIETSTNSTSEVKTQSATPTVNGSAAIISTYRGERDINPANTLEPARMAEARSAEVVNQVSSALEVMAKSRQHTLRIQLNPEDLGRIDLRMTTSQNGLAVVLSADQAATGKMLEGELARLKHSLENAGIQLAQLAIRQEGAKGQPFESPASFRGKASAAKTVKGIAPVDVKAESGQPRSLQANTLIDYQV